MAEDQRWSPSRVLSPPSPAADAPPLPLARKAALRASTQRACSSADAGSSRSMPRTAGQKQRDGTGRGSVNSRVQTASRPIAARCCLAACFCVTAALRCAVGSCAAASLLACVQHQVAARQPGGAVHHRPLHRAAQGLAEEAAGVQQLCREGREEAGQAGMVGQRGRCMNTTYRGRRAGHVTGVCSQWLGTPRWQCPLPRPLSRPAPLELRTCPAAGAGAQLDAAHRAPLLEVALHPGLVHHAALQAQGGGWGGRERNEVQ